MKQLLLIIVITICAASTTSMSGQCRTGGFASSLASEVAATIAAAEGGRTDPRNHAGIAIEVAEPQFTAPKPGKLSAAVWDQFVKTVKDDACLTQAKLKTELTRSMAKPAVVVVAANDLATVRDYYSRVRELLRQATGGSIAGLDPDTANRLQLNDVNYVLQVTPSYELERDGDEYSGTYRVVASAPYQLLAVETGALSAGSQSAQAVQSYTAEHSVTFSAGSLEPWSGEIPGQATIWYGPVREMTVTVEVQKAPFCASRFDVALTSSSLKAYPCSLANRGFCDSRQRIGFSENGECIAPGSSHSFTFKFPPWEPVPYTQKMFRYATISYAGPDDLDDGSF